MEEYNYLRTQMINLISGSRQLNVFQRDTILTQFEYALSHRVPIRFNTVSCYPPAVLEETISAIINHMIPARASWAVETINLFVQILRDLRRQYPIHFDNHDDHLYPYQRLQLLPFAR
jgi:hypothetical protein